MAAATEQNNARDNKRSAINPSGDEIDARYLTLEEIHQEELNLLLKFQKLCNDNNLKFSLAGGTLLGAVRHKGFIPWDDDIDVTMPRQDYESFLRLSKDFAKDFKYKIELFPGYTNSPLLFKFVSSEVRVKERFVADTRGLWLDVLPVDVLPNSEIDITNIYSKAKRLRNVVVLASADASEAKTKVKKALKPLAKKVITFCRIDQICAKKLDSLSKSFNEQKTDSIGGIAWGLYGAGERIPATAFVDMPLLEFEGFHFPVYSCWDAYLTGLYGNYMKLPPEDQRQTHELKAWRVADFSVANTKDGE